MITDQQAIPVHEIINYKQKSRQYDHRNNKSVANYII